MSQIQFSYDIVSPKLRCYSCHGYGCSKSCRKWHIYEKGSIKKREKYDISATIVSSAMSLLTSKGIKKILFKKSSLCRNEHYNIYFTEENDQCLNSVKTRGVIYTLDKLSYEEKRKGVIAISTGTFALILCHYGRQLDISVTIVMPTSAAQEDVIRCKSIADTVFIGGQDLKESHIIALSIAMTKGLTYIDGNDHPNMIIGQATLGLDMCQQIKAIDAIILPTTIDGCGLTMAVALMIKKYNSNIKVYEAFPEMPHRSCVIQDVRRKTTLINELPKICLKQYDYYDDFTCVVNKCFDDIVKVTTPPILCPFGPTS